MTLTTAKDGQGAHTTEASAPTENLPATTGVYEMMKRDSVQLRDVLRANIGDRGVSSFRLRRLKVPTGVQKQWIVPTLKGLRSLDRIEGIIVGHSEPRGYWRAAGVTNQPPDCMSD